MNAAETLAKVALRISVLSRDGIAAPQAAWIDETLKIANAGLAEATGVAGANGYAAFAGEDDSKRTTASGDAEPSAFEKFLTVAPGVTLVRFHGRDEIKLVSRRVGKSGNPNTIFEIIVDKAAKIATVWRDERILFEIQGVTVGYSKVEAMAVSSLKRWFKDQRRFNAQRRRKRKAKQDAAKVADEIAKAEGGAK